MDSQNLAIVAPVSLAQQISQLEQANIKITDQEEVKLRLIFVGSYRLLSYARPLLAQYSHAELPFNMLWDLYMFDRKLRLLVSDAIERIEVAFRTSVSDEMSWRYTEHWYLQANLFKRCDWHTELLAKIDNLLVSQRHPLIQNFYRTHTKTVYPPSCMLAECLTFGVWSKIFQNLKYRADKILIARRLGQSPIVMQSWVRCFTECRNLCAHHERLWNHFWCQTPKALEGRPEQQYRLYQQLHIINVVLKQIAPGTDWLRRLHTLFETYNHLPIFAGMGFDEVWTQDVLWL